MERRKNTDRRYSRRRETTERKRSFILQSVVACAVVLGILVASRFTGVGDNVHDAIRYQVDYRQTVQQLWERITQEKEQPKEGTEDAVDDTNQQAQDT